MKIGLILECDRGGTDEQVYKYLIKKLCPGMELVTQPAGSNKKSMIAACGKTAKQLLADGCDKVMIIWDLYPSWGEENPSRQQDVAAIQANLTVEEVNQDKVELVCIAQMLETILLADGGGAVTAYKAHLLRGKPHIKKLPVFAPKDIHTTKPKSLIDSYLADGSGRKKGYNELTDTVKMIQRIDDLSVVAANMPSFQQLVDVVDAHCPPAGPEAPARGRRP